MLLSNKRQTSQDQSQFVKLVIIWCLSPKMARSVRYFFLLGLFGKDSRPKSGLRFCYRCLSVTKVTKCCQHCVCQEICSLGQSFRWRRLPKLWWFLIQGDPLIYWGMHGYWSSLHISWPHSQTIMTLCNKHFDGTLAFRSWVACFRICPGLEGEYIHSW